MPNLIEIKLQLLHETGCPEENRHHIIAILGDELADLEVAGERGWGRVLMAGVPVLDGLVAKARLNQPGRQT